MNWLQQFVLRPIPIRSCMNQLKSHAFITSSTTTNCLPLKGFHDLCYFSLILIKTGFSRLISGAKTSHPLIAAVSLYTQPLKVYLHLIVFGLLVFHRFCTVYQQFFAKWPCDLPHKKYNNFCFSACMRQGY